MLTAYIITLLSVSLITTLVYAVDKINAICANGPEGRRCVFRVPEIVLITIPAMGGVLGAILSTIFFNHKSNMSRKWFFFLTILFSAIVQLILLPLYLIVH